MRPAAVPQTTEPCPTAPPVPSTLPHHSKVPATGVTCWPHFTDAQPLVAPLPQVAEVSPAPAQSTKQNHSPASVAIPGRRRPLSTIPPRGPVHKTLTATQMRTQGSPIRAGDATAWSLGPLRRLEPPCSVTGLAL